MLDFREVKIDDKKLFEKRLLESNKEASDYNFTNFFMWKDCYNLKLVEIMGTLCVISVPQSSCPFVFMPMGKINEDNFPKIVSLLKEYFSNNNWSLRFERVVESNLHYFSGIVDLEKDVEFDRDNSDYVYLSKDLIDLKGKKYNSKRNHIKKFVNNHRYEFVEINNTNIYECSQVLEKWCSKRNCEEHGTLYCEREVNDELLNNFEKLDCFGGILKVDGVAEAFTIGEMLNDETAVIHVEKANADIQGLYPFLNQYFCKNSFYSVKYINREQDLGIEGLRKAKISYNPHMLVKKYSVTVR